MWHFHSVGIVHSHANHVYFNEIRSRKLKVDDFELCSWIQSFVLKLSWDCWVLDEIVLVLELCLIRILCTFSGYLNLKRNWEKESNLSESGLEMKMEKFGQTWQQLRNGFATRSQYEPHCPVKNNFDSQLVLFIYIRVFWS